jgi:hypothetical protein
VSRLTFRLQDSNHEIERLRERNAELAGLLSKAEARAETAEQDMLRQRVKSSEAVAVEAERRELENRLAVALEERDVLRAEVSQLTLDSEALRRKVRASVGVSGLSSVASRSMRCLVHDGRVAVLRTSTSLVT